MRLPGHCPSTFGLQRQQKRQAIVQCLSPDADVEAARKRASRRFRSRGERQVIEEGGKNATSGGGKWFAKIGGTPAHINSLRTESYVKKRRVRFRGSSRVTSKTHGTPAGRKADGASKEGTISVRPSIGLISLLQVSKTNQRQCRG